MEQFVYPTLTAFFAALIAYFFAKRKNTADAKSAEIDAEIKSADFYKSLLDDAGNRINQCLEIIKMQDGKILERDKKIDLLLIEIEHLTDELRKFKQLNGKV